MAMPTAAHRALPVALWAVLSGALFGCRARPASVPELLAQGDLKGACYRAAERQATQLERDLVKRRGQEMLEGRLILAPVSGSELARLLDHPIVDQRQTILLHHRFEAAIEHADPNVVFKVVDRETWSDKARGYDALVAIQRFRGLRHQPFCTSVERSKSATVLPSRRA
jgi:hypothetical protein